MFVEDHMTSDPQTTKASALLARACELMERHTVHHLPVVDDARRLAGIISDRDVRSAVGFDATLREKLTVAEVMTPDPTTIPVKATLDEALKIFCSSRFGALPVVRSKTLVGIITRLDCLEALSQVLGLDEPGRRVEIALPNGASDIALAFQAISNCEGAIISAVVSRMRRDGGEPSLYLRVAGDYAAKVERCLHQAALVVLEPEHE